jgi:hypothetical protein
MSLSCPRCRQAAAPEWTRCAYCDHELKPARSPAGVRSAARNGIERALGWVLGFVIVLAALAAFRGGCDSRTTMSDGLRNASTGSVANANASSPPSVAQLGDYRISFPLTPKAATSSDVVDGVPVVLHSLTATASDGGSSMTALYVDYTAAGRVFNVDKALAGASDGALKEVESAVGIGNVHVRQDTGRNLGDLPGRYITAQVDPGYAWTFHIGCRAHPTPRCYILQAQQNAQRSFTDDDVRDFNSSFVPSTIATPPPASVNATGNGVIDH